MKRTYECTTSFSLPFYDEDNEDADKMLAIESGSIWERNDLANILGADIHLDCDDGSWIEISKETLATHFKEVRLYDYQ